MYRKMNGTEVLLVHPGGPFFSKKDLGVWSVPKGEYTETEDPLTAAIREFEEETGQHLEGNFISLTPIKQKGGKLVRAWAVEGDIVAERIVSNTFEMVWPPQSQKLQTFPEVDRAEWFDIEKAKEKINQGQIPFLVELNNILNENAI